jgi:ankyrin repeat protein
MVRADNADLLECIYDLVLEDQKDRNSEKQGSFSLLHLAAGSDGGVKCLDYLLNKAKEYPNQLCNDVDRATPLHFAVLANKLDNAKMLLRYGANVNSRDSMGNTALHFAVQNRNLRLVKALEELGGNATLKNEDELCAIDTTITEDYKEIKMYFMS